MKLPLSPKSLSFLVLSSSFGAGVASAGTFSIFGSPTGLGDELFLPGPLPFGVGGTPLEVNGLSYGHVGVTSLGLFGGYQFSVDALVTAGAPGSLIAAEIASGESASADVYGTLNPPGGFHFGVWDGDGLGPGPNGLGGSAPLGIVDGVAGPPDDVDGWDARIPTVTPPPVYFTLDGASSGAAGVAPGDIMFSPVIPGYAAAGAPAVVAPAGALGLGPGDDVNALVVLDNDGMPGTFTPGVDVIMYSLAPGSPTLGGFGISAADILVDPAAAGLLGVPTIGGAGTPGFVVPSGALGLLPGDDLNALDIVQVQNIPEPTSTSLLGLSLACLLLRHRRR